MMRVIHVGEMPANGDHMEDHYVSEGFKEEYDTYNGIVTDYDVVVERTDAPLDERTDPPLDERTDAPMEEDAEDSLTPEEYQDDDVVDTDRYASSSTGRWWFFFAHHGESKNGGN